MPITTAIFDAYGTLFDVAAAAREAATENEQLARHWPQIANDWRLKQLQYTWLRAVADRHCDFWQVTCDGLDWALESAGIQDSALRETLLALYRDLSAYPEVPEVLATLSGRGIRTGILSNGSPDMLAAAVASAGIGQHLNAVLSVEDAGVFKPHKAVYDMVGQHFGTQPSEVLFVSSNGWDAAGAADYGFQTAWVNRASEPQDRLFARPQHTVQDLHAIPELCDAG